MNNDFKCCKCKSSPEKIYLFGPVMSFETAKEEGKEYCEKCWRSHPLNKQSGEVESISEAEKAHRNSEKL